MVLSDAGLYCVFLTQHQVVNISHTSEYRCPAKFLTMTFTRHALWFHLSVTGNADMGHLCSLSDRPTGSG